MGRAGGSSVRSMEGVRMGEGGRMHVGGMDIGVVSNNSQDMGTAPVPKVSTGDVAYMVTAVWCGGIL